MVFHICHFKQVVDSSVDRRDNVGPSSSDSDEIMLATTSDVEEKLVGEMIRRPHESACAELVKPLPANIWGETSGHDRRPRQLSLISKKVRFIKGGRPGGRDIVCT